MAQNAVGNLSVKMSVDLAQLRSGFKSVNRETQQVAGQVQKHFARGFNIGPTITAGTKQGTAAISGLATKARGLGGTLVSAFNPLSKIGLITTALGAAGGISLGGLSTKAIRLAADLEMTQVAFRTMIGDAETANRLVGDLRKFAASTPFTSEQALGAARQMLAYGFAAEQTIPALRMLGDVSSALNVDLGEMAYLFGTLKAQGRAYTIDIRQFAMRGVPIWQELAAVMKTTVSNVKTMVEEGSVDFSKVATAFKTMTRPARDYSAVLDELAGKSGVSVNQIQSLALAGVPAWESLAATVGVSTAEVQRLATEGKITFADLTAAAKTFTPDKAIADALKEIRSGIGGTASLGDIEGVAAKGIPVWEFLTKTMDGTEEKIRDMVKTGKVGFKELEKAILEAGKAGQFGGLTKEQGLTFRGQLNRLTSTIDEGLTSFGDMLINDTPARGWIETAIRSADSLKSAISGIKPEIIAIANVSESLMNTHFNGIKQIGAYLRVGLNVFKAVFPEFLSWMGKLVDTGREGSLTWIEAKKNALSFFEAVGPFTGKLIDGFRMFGGAIIDGVVIPFQQGRIAAIELRESIMANLDAARGLSGMAGNSAREAWQRLTGGADTAGMRVKRSIAESARQGLEGAFVDWQKTKSELALDDVNTYASRLNDAFKGIQGVDSDFLKSLERLKTLTTGRPNEANYTEITNLVTRLQKSTPDLIGRVFADVETTFQKINRLNQSIQENQTLVAELSKAKYEGRFESAITRMKGEIAALETIEQIQKANLQANVFGLQFPVLIDPDASKLEDLFGEFKIDPPKISVELEAKAQDLRKQFVSPLTKFRKEYADLQELFKQEEISKSLFDQAAATAYKELVSATGNLESKRDLAAGIDSYGSDAITERLRFETFGSGSRELDMQAVFTRIRDIEAAQYTELVKIAERLANINIPVPAQTLPQ